MIYNYVMNNKVEDKSQELIHTQLEMVLASQKVASSITVRSAATTNYITTGDLTYLDIFKEYSEIADEQNKYLNKLDPASADERQAVSEQAVNWREKFKKMFLMCMMQEMIS